MYSMVLMAALTTGTDMPDLGGRRRGGGGCCGCYGGMGYGGCYGGGYGGCYGGGYGGWGGCYGGGWGGGYGGGWGGGYGWGGYGRGGYGWGGVYGGSYAWGGYSPWTGGYTYSPMMTSGYGTPIVSGTPLYGNTGTMQSFYFNPSMNQGTGNEATLIVHLPADATLTVDGERTQSTSSTRVFISPPLEPGKSYHYTLRGELNRAGRTDRASKTVQVRAGERTEVTLDFPGGNQGERLNPPSGEPNGEGNAGRASGTLPRPPGDR